MTLLDPPQLPSDIQWHFIGNLQSNKVKLATGKPFSHCLLTLQPRADFSNGACSCSLAIPNLFVLETLDSIKKADMINKQLEAHNREKPLNVYIQINTSGEENKAGFATPKEGEADGEAVALALHIVNKCPHVRLLGLMTIGSFEHSHAEGTRNPDFLALVDAREKLIGALKKAGVEAGRVGREGEEWRLELSMGMSADFAEALKEGSDSVRVGTRCVSRLDNVKIGLLSLT